MKYTIIRNDNLAKFEETVEWYISRGWKVAGGVAIDAQGFFYQAMKK